MNLQDYNSNKLQEKNEQLKPHSDNSAPDLSFCMSENAAFTEPHAFSHLNIKQLVR